MPDLADILQTGDRPAWPYEETGFSASMRRRADRLPQIPARLSMSNFLRGMFNAAADVNDAIYAAKTGRQPFVVGMPDLVHTPGQEDYRPAPLGPQHIIAAATGGVLPRGVPAEDRKGFTKEAYEAWLKQQEEIRRAKAIADSPHPPNATRPKDWDPGGGLY